MGIGREQRLSEILDIVLKEDGDTGAHLAEMFGVSRGTILNDIAVLRRRGYPIQVSAMVKEDGILSARYEIPRYLKNISAANAERH